MRKFLLLAILGASVVSDGELFEVEPALLIRKDSSEPGKLLPPTPAPLAPRAFQKDPLQAGGVRQGVFWNKVEGMVDRIADDEVRVPAAAPSEAPALPAPPPVRPDGGTQ